LEGEAQDTCPYTQKIYQIKNGQVVILG